MMQPVLGVYVVIDDAVAYHLCQCDASMPILSVVLKEEWERSNRKTLKLLANSSVAVWRNCYSNVRFYDSFAFSGHNSFISTG